MKIAYLCHARFPTEKAYGHQIAQVAAALMENGHDVTIVCPRDSNALKGSLSAIYRMRRDVPIEPLAVTHGLLLPGVPPPLAVHVTWFSYRRALRRWLRDRRPELVYARHAAVIEPALALGIPVILELHTIPSRFQWNFVRRCNACRRVVALTTPMRDELIRRGVDPARIVVEPDGVDLASFASLPSPTAAKRSWSLPEDRPVVAYVGSLKTGHDLPKGVEELIEAAANLHTPPFLLWIVGGPKADVERLRTLAITRGCHEDRIRFEGPVPSADVPRALAAADIAVYPAPKSTDPFFVRDTSPLKLLEYMAAGVPIVSADLPPIRDLLDASTAELCAPGDPEVLAGAMKHILNDRPAAQARAAHARTIVERYDWKKRMERLIP